MKTGIRIMIITVAIITAQLLRANILYVDDSGDKDYYTITEAMQYARPGDIVYMHAGTYNEKLGEQFPIPMAPGVTLLGEDPEKSVIDARGTRAPVIKLQGTADVIIKSVKIINAKKGIEVRNGSDRFTLTNCAVHMIKGTALRIVKSNDASITSCVLAGGQKAVVMDRASNVSLLKNTLVGKSTANKNVGIFSKKSRAQVKYNLIERFGTGIRVDKQSPEDLYAVHNNVHACITPYQDHMGGSIVFDSPDDVGNTSTDPQFIDLMSGNLALQKTSPCRGLGAFAVVSDDESVSMFMLKARIMEDHIQLKWLTSSEHANKGWNIYKGVNADGPYVKVNEEVIMGAGTSNMFNEYVFRDTDMSLVGNNVYYYLEQIDFDDNTTYSPMISVSINQTDMEALTNISYPDIQ